HSTNRKLIPWYMRDNGTVWDGNVHALEALITPDTRVLIVCNPQNPTGHVFSREELLQIGDIAEKHDLIIVSDEIHCDILFDNAAHIPLCSLSPQIAARTFTLNSASNSFNIPLMRCAVIHFGTAALRDL